MEIKEPSERPDDDAPYRMPPFTGRNILIFSDGTGQAGGLHLDEYRSNVYKLFRATRCGPDSDIDPDRQLAFYDPGLGSKLSGEDIKIGMLRRIYNGLSSATGLGITKNIIDCYAALIQLWRPGDRIFLFGFSRGAYTVRCLGGVLSLCGIPERGEGDTPLLRDPATARKIAREAVIRVYRHGSGADDKVEAAAAKARKNGVKGDQQALGKEGSVADAEGKADVATARKESLGAQRQALGRQFRKKYQATGPHGPNIVPHFIGVWDTVAAVGVSPPLAALAKLAALVLFVATAAGTAWLQIGALNVSFLLWSVGTLAALIAITYTIYIGMRVKFVTGLPGYKWHQTLHLTSFKMAFFDKSLNRYVRYARHALAIDENRADFDRVPWVNDGEPPNRDMDEGAWWKQYWFAGNHSDIGGSYSENESRLSDLALGWMVHQAKKAGLLVNDNYLRLFGRHTGPQHDECRVGISLFGFKFKWREHTRAMVQNATLHPSVKLRIHEKNVFIYDAERAYRPALLAGHREFKDLYEREARERAEDSSGEKSLAEGRS